MADANHQRLFSKLSSTPSNPEVVAFPCSPQWSTSRRENTNRIQPDSIRHPSSQYDGRATTRRNTRPEALRHRRTRRNDSLGRCLMLRPHQLAGLHIVQKTKNDTSSSRLMAPRRPKASKVRYPRFGVAPLPINPQCTIARERSSLRQLLPHGSSRDAQLKNMHRDFSSPNV